jgi:cytochrome b pre-mRNA-processing protein 3
MNIAAPAEQRTLPFASVVTVALVVLLSVGLIAWHHRRAQAELQSMPTVERAALYERTLSTLRTTCPHADGVQLHDYCQEQAIFVSRFPECDAQCQATCREFLPRATK